MVGRTLGLGGWLLAVGLSLLSVAEKAVKFGEGLGAGEVEAYAALIEGRRVVAANQIETLYATRMGGLGVRVIVGKRNGFFATSSLRVKDVEKAVETAYNMAKLSEQDKDWHSLPKKTGRANVEKVFDRRTSEIEPSALIEGAVQMIDTVNNFGRNISITRTEVGAGTGETAIVNSHGCDLWREETFASTSISVKAEEGEMRGVSSEDQQARSWGGLDCSLVAKVAAERASKVMYAKPIVGGRMPVVWHGKLFASILGIMFGGTLSADSVQKGRSPWIGKIGRDIASENFSLLDDGLLRGGLGTREFDDDGVAQQRVMLIDRGVLQGFLYDNYTANKEGRESTGNSSRSYRSLPIPSSNNLSLQPGRVKREELLDVRRGLYLVETIGEWLSNPVSGDLSATATNAFLIEDGELTKPVKGVIVSGNFFEILRNRIALIADDVENSGSTYSPSARISEMTITGE